MNIELRSVPSLSVDEISSCSTDGIDLLFADLGPNDLSTESVTKWLSNLKSAEEHGDELRYVLWSHGDFCGPLAMCAVSRVFAELDFAHLRCYYSEESLQSGLARATCQSVISEAFEKNLTSHILAKASRLDTETQGLYESIPLSICEQLTALGCGSVHAMPYEIQRGFPGWRSWDHHRVLAEAETRFQECLDDGAVLDDCIPSQSLADTGCNGVVEVKLQ